MQPAIRKSLASAVRRRLRQTGIRRSFRRLCVEVLETRDLLASDFLDALAPSVLPPTIDLVDVGSSNANPGPRGSSPGSLTDVEGTHFLGANDGIHGAELWMSDGASERTRLGVGPKSGESSETSLAQRGTSRILGSGTGLCIEKRSGTVAELSEVGFSSVPRPATGCPATVETLPAGSAGRPSHDQGTSRTNSALGRAYIPPRTRCTALARVRPR